MARASETIARIQRNGWAPVRWAHHPDGIKRLIHDAGFRPKAKGCYTNCGKLLVACLDTEYESDLTYCEGVFRRGQFGVAHAWLRYRGEIVDLTIVDGNASQYEQQLEMTPERFAKQCYRVGNFGPFVPPDPRLEALAMLTATRC